MEEVGDLDERWRKVLARAEELRAEQKELSKQYAQNKDEAALAGLRTMADQVKTLTAEAYTLRTTLDDLLLRVPNLFDESVPVGETEADNVVVREWGSKPGLGFAARTHYDLGETLGIMDFERAARVSGSRFAFLLGEGARLERALVQFMLDVHTREHGYTEVLPPVLVSSASMTGNANLRKLGAAAFKIKEHDLWLIPTTEVRITNFRAATTEVRRVLAVLSFGGGRGGQGHAWIRAPASVLEGGAGQGDHRRNFDGRVREVDSGRGRHPEAAWSPLQRARDVHR
jgi:seryl-tRNA synthetase